MAFAADGNRAEGEFRLLRSKFKKKKTKKKRAPSSILHEAKITYYARNMFEAARLVFS